METTSSNLRNQAREYIRQAEFTAYEERAHFEALAVKCLDEADRLDGWADDGAPAMVDPDHFDGRGHA